MPDSAQPADRATVLVAEDDRDLADTYTIWLESEYDVRTAYSGSEALTWYDSSVDVVLLDRRIPDISGTKLIEDMARRDVDDQKALLTSVEPGSELVELPCDDYLTKPITKSRLRDAIRELHIRKQLDDELQRHFTITSKIAALENSTVEATDDAVADLRREAERTRARIDDRIAELDGPGYKVLE